MKQYIQPQTMATEFDMTTALLAASYSPAPTRTVTFIGGGDPADGR